MAASIGRTLDGRLREAAARAFLARLQYERLTLSELEQQVAQRMG